MVVLVAFVIYRTHFLHKKRVAENEVDADEAIEETLTNTKIINKASKNVIKTLDKIGNSLNDTIVAFSKEDLKKLKSTFQNFEKINAQTKSLKDNVSKTIDKLEESAVESGHFYVQVVGYLREIAHSTYHIIMPVEKHLDNSHKSLLPVQFDEITEIQTNINELIAVVNKAMKDQDFTALEKVIEEQRETLKLIKLIRKNQVKRIKENEIGTRNSMLIFNILEEYKNIILNMVNLLKSYRDFINFINGGEEFSSEEI